MAAGWFSLKLVQKSTDLSERSELSSLNTLLSLFVRIRSPSHSLQNIKSASVENPCLLDISGGEHATHFLILIVAFQDWFLRSIRMFLFWIPAPVFSMVNLKYTITKKGRGLEVRKAQRQGRIL